MAAVSEKRVIISLRTDGTRTVRREIDGVAKSSNKLARELGRMGAQSRRTETQLGRLGKRSSGVFSGMKSSIKGLVGSFSRLNLAMAALGAGYALRNFVRLADEYNSLQSKLQNVTYSSQELNEAWDELYAAAQRSSTSVSDMTKGFINLKLATAGMGLSTKEVIDLSETIAKTLSVVGASSEEASRAMVQFYQGLATGTLRGQDFKSVVSSIPLFVDKLGKHMGYLGKTSESTLKQMVEAAEKGELTSKRIVDAVKRMGGEVDSLKEGMADTTEQATTRLKNASLAFVGVLDRVTQATTIWRGTLNTLTFILEKVTKFTNELLAVQDKFFQLIADGIFYIYVWAKGIDAAAAQQEIFSRALKDFKGVAKAAQEAVKEYKTETAKFETALKTVTSAYAMSNREKRISAYLSEVEAKTKRKLTLQERISAAVAYETLQRELEKKDLLEKIQGPMRRYTKSVSLLNQLKAEGKINEDEYNKALKDLNRLLGSQPPPLKLPSFKDYVRDLEQARRVMLMSNAGRELHNALIGAEIKLKRALTEEEKKRITGIINGSQALLREAEMLESIRGPAMQRMQDLDTLNILLKKNLISEAEHAEKFDQILGNKDLPDRIDEFAESMKRLRVQGIERTADAFVDFVATGKLELTSLIRDISAAILKLIVMKGLMTALGIDSSGAGTGTGLLGALFGGAAPKAEGALPKAARGLSFKVGGSGGTDSQMVSFRATPGETVDVRTPSQEQRPQAAPVINVVNITDPSAGLDVMASGEGRDLIINTIARDPETVRRILGVA